MSLINQMLRDLESGAGSHAAKPAFLRAAPAVRRRRWSLADWLLAGAGLSVAVISIVLAAWSFLRPAPASKTAPAPAVNQAAPAASPATPSPAPPVAPASAAPAAAMPPIAPLAVPQPASPAVAASVSDSEKKKP